MAKRLVKYGQLFTKYDHGCRPLCKEYGCQHEIANLKEFTKNGILTHVRMKLKWRF